MTRYEKELNEMTIEKMAEYLIIVHNIDNGYYDYNDEWQSWYEEVYESPLCDDVYYHNKKDCIDDTIIWLKEEI